MHATSAPLPAFSCRLKFLFMRLHFLFLLGLSTALGSFATHAQTPDRHTLSGYITDAATGETLIGATVWAESLSQGVATNVYGFYTLTLPAGTYDVRVSYLGLHPPALRGGPHGHGRQTQPGTSARPCIGRGGRDG